MDGFDKQYLEATNTSTGTGITFQCTSMAIAGEGTSTGEGMGKRKIMGGQKIKMEKIESKSNLQVTFSKRRKGIFKKAHQLAAMTGAEVESIVFSPAGKVYSYGSPNIMKMIERFTTGVYRPLNHFERVVKDMGKKKVIETSAELEDHTKQLAIGKKHRVWLDQQLALIEFKCWDMNNMNPADLQRSKEMLQKVKKVISKEIDKHSTAWHRMYYSGEGISPSMHVANPTAYAGGEGNSRAVGSYSGDFFKFTAGASGSRVGGLGSGLVLYHPSKELYGGGTGCFSMGAGRSAFLRVRSSHSPYTIGPSSYHGGAGGTSSDTAGAYIFGGAHGRVGDVGTGGFLIGTGSNAFQRVGSNRRPFTVEPISYFGDSYDFSDYGDEYAFGGDGAYTFACAGSGIGYTNAVPDISVSDDGCFADMAGSTCCPCGGLSIRNKTGTTEAGNSGIEGSDVMSLRGFGRGN